MAKARTESRRARQARMLHQLGIPFAWSVWERDSIQLYVIGGGK